MSEQTHEGGCLCGAVRYRIQGQPAGRPLCHCSMCRRAAGAPVVAWMTVPSARFAFTQGAPVRYVSSATASRQFCGRCGSQLTFQYTATPEELDVTTCTLDNPETLPPTHHTFHADRLSWLALSDTLRRHPRDSKS